MHITDISIRQLKPPAKGQKTHFDDGLKGFGVRVSQGGTKTFVLMYGKSRRLTTIGRIGVVKLKDARERARNILADHQLNGDRAESKLFASALEQFMKGYAEKNKASTVSETERLLNRYLKPACTGKVLGDITKAMLVKELDAIAAKSERRHFYTAAHTFFRWARRYEIINPLEGVEKPPKSSIRQRLLTNGEFVSVWRASLKMGKYGLLIRCLLATGQRLNQIASLNSAHIDCESRLIHWPGSLMKSNQDFFFPYGNLTSSLLPQGDGLLFPTENGEPFNNWTDSHKDLLRRAAIPHFTRHDCRRFYSSTHSAIGTQPHIRELLLSHAFGSVVSRTYDLYTYLPEKRAAQETYEQHLATLVGT